MKSYRVATVSSDWLVDLVFYRINPKRLTCNNSILSIEAVKVFTGSIICIGIRVILIEEVR